jgi:AraC-like DNA-binding protein
MSTMFRDPLRSRHLLSLSMERAGIHSREIKDNIGYSRSIGELKIWVINHLDDKHTLQTLATRTGMSVTTMQRAFKCTYGCSIFAYIRYERLIRAQKQLEVTAMNIKSISAVAGYSSVPAFTTAFYSTFGHTPGRFRKRIK